jgi:hypothetical protein
VAKPQPKNKRLEHELHEYTNGTNKKQKIII